MQEIWSDFKSIAKDRKYLIPIILTAIFSYITLIIRPTVGIDDTAIDLYFEKGVAPAAGRWVLYLINKVFGFISYNPHFVELLGVAVFVISTCLWCVLFKRLFKDKLPDAVVITAACVLISSPILSEILVWYLQNGIYMAYGITALAVLCFLQLMEESAAKRTKAVMFGLSSLFLVIAIGCYESYMFVFIIACVLSFVVKRITEGKQKKQLLRYLVYGVAICGVSLVLRTVIIEAVVLIFGLQDQEGILRTRSMSEALVWFNGEKSIEDLVYIWKQFFVSYFANAAAYLPITIFVLAMCAILGVAFCQSIKKRDAWIMVAALMVVLIPWLLPVIEGEVTPYRSAQYIPVVVAFGVLMTGYFFRKVADKRLVVRLGVFAVVFLLYHQIFEMNKWFYVDYLKYEDAVRYMDELAMELKRDYDTNKPLVITGSHEVPYAIVEEGYVPYWSRKYTIVSTMINLVDPELLSLYNTEHGYAYVQTPFLSVIDWGTGAFYHTDVQLVEFMRMHGHDLTADHNYDHYLESWEIDEDMPHWPKEGSIVDMESYILIHL